MKHPLKPPRATPALKSPEELSPILPQNTGLPAGVGSPGETDRSGNGRRSHRPRPAAWVPPAAAATLAAAILLPGLAACGRRAGYAEADPSRGDPAVTSSTPAGESSGGLSGPTSDALAPLRAELAALEAALLQSREDAYIERETYRSRIEALEAELERLAAATAPAEALPPEPAESTGPADSPTEGTPGEPARPAMAFDYEIRDGRAVILRFRGDEESVTVPAVISGYPVTRIADYAFMGSSVSAVVLEAPLHEIGWFAFSGCPSLRAVTLPASVERIEYGAFDDSPSVVLHVSPNSYAAAYAQSYGLPRVEA